MPYWHGGAQAPGPRAQTPECDSDGPQWFGADLKQVETLTMRRFVRKMNWAVTLGVTTALTLAATAAAQQVDPTYQQLKNLQGLFPIPTPTATVQVGTFDPISGNFTGLKSTQETIDEVTGAGGKPAEPGGANKAGSDPSSPQRKPQTVLVPPEVNVDAVDVTLTWSLSRAGAMQVTANGVTVGTQGNQTTVSIDVGKAESVRWTARSSTKFYSDTLIINRPPTIGVGAFTVPALPLAVVYEPPQYDEGKNFATYSQTKSMGTTMRVSFQREDSTAVPMPGRFDSTKQFKDGLEVVESLLDLVGFFAGGGGGDGGKGSGGSQGAGLGTILEKIGKGLKLLNDALGSTTATTQQGVRITIDHAISIQALQQDTFTTGSHDGPGVGDRIIYLKNARLAWVLNPSGVQLMLLSWEALATDSVSILSADLAQLKASARSASTIKPLPPPPVGQKTGLNQATLQALLALDPFVGGGPGVSLTSPTLNGRFSEVEQYEWSGSGTSGSGDTHKFQYSVTQSDLTSTTNFVVNSEDDKKGLLAFLGIGVTEDQSTKTTVQNSHSQEVDSQSVVATTVQLFAGEGERHSMKAFYDNIFGTFAFQDVPTGRAFVAGDLKDKQGNPLAHQEIRLTAGGKSYVTRSDAQGNYEFRSSQLKPGRMTLSAGTARQQIDASTGPVRGVKLIATL
jgi:hypothetical protein